MTEERRRFYRIDDEILLRIDAISESEAEARLKDFLENQHAFSLRNNFNLQIEQHIADFKRISQKMPELGRYLAVLQSQIDALSERQDRGDFGASLTGKLVNLSAQGIAFNHDEAPDQGSLVELSMKLIPSGIMLVIIARVVRLTPSTEDSEGKNRIALDFEYIHEADREILVKYVHSKQMKTLTSGQIEDG